MSRNLSRHVLVAVVACAAVGVAAPAAAAPKPRVPVTKPAKPAKPARYVVVGTLATVDGAAITLAPTTGGNAKTRPAPVTVTVAGGATVIRDDVAATLADLVAGDHVAASGTRSGTVVTITKVVATSPEPPAEVVG